VYLGFFDPTKFKTNLYSAKPDQGEPPLSDHWGRSPRNCTIANSKENPWTPLPISLRWLEYVDNELSALAVNFSLKEIIFHNNLPSGAPGSYRPGGNSREVVRMGMLQ